jgi:acetoin utilization deacetylase AcuC-like enzyme
MDRWTLWFPKNERILLVFSVMLVFVFVMQARSALQEELLLLHTQKHIKLMQETACMKLKELEEKQDDFRSVYLHPDSYQAACLAAGSVLQVRILYLKYMGYRG